MAPSKRIRTKNTRDAPKQGVNWKPPVVMKPRQSIDRGAATPKSVVKPPVVRRPAVPIDEPSMRTYPIIFSNPIIQPRSTGGLSTEELSYIDTLEHEERKILMGKIKSASQNGGVPLRFRVLASSLPGKEDIFQRLKATDTMKYEGWVQNALRLPLAKFSRSPTIGMGAEMHTFLSDHRRTMDDVIFGQAEAKDEIIRMLCQWSRGGGSSFAIGLEGPPGIGKTTFAKEAISRAVNRPFALVSVGGASDASLLCGHSFTYEGAICGRLADIVTKAGVMDPVIYIDELDKISKTAKGDELANVFIHLTDRGQNESFRDRYFHGLFRVPSTHLPPTHLPTYLPTHPLISSGIDLDLSRAIFVFSYNDANAINPVLLDRLQVIKMQAPTIDAKVEIAKRFFVPRSLANFNLTGQIVVSEEMLRCVIETFTDEIGVRGLDKTICRLLNTLSVSLCAGKVLEAVTFEIPDHDHEQPLVVSQRMLHEILLSPKKSEHEHSLMYM